MQFPIELHREYVNETTALDPLHSIDDVETLGLI